MCWSLKMNEVILKEKEENERDALEWKTLRGKKKVTE